MDLKTDLNSYPGPVSIVYETEKYIQEIYLIHIKWFLHSLFSTARTFLCTIIEELTKFFQVACSRTCIHIHYLCP